MESSAVAYISAATRNSAITATPIDKSLVLVGSFASRNMLYVIRGSLGIRRKSLRYFLFTRSAIDHPHHIARNSSSQLIMYTR